MAKTFAINENVVLSPQSPPPQFMPRNSQHKHRKSQHKRVLSQQDRALSQQELPNVQHEKQLLSRPDADRFESNLGTFNAQFFDLGLVIRAWNSKCKNEQA